MIPSIPSSPVAGVSCPAFSNAPYPIFKSKSRTIFFEHHRGELHNLIQHLISQIFLIFEMLLQKCHPVFLSPLPQFHPKLQSEIPGSTPEFRKLSYLKRYVLSITSGFSCSTRFPSAVIENTARLELLIKTGFLQIGPAQLIRLANTLLLMPLGNSTAISSSVSSKSSATYFLISFSSWHSAVFQKPPEKVYAFQNIGVCYSAYCTPSMNLHEFQISFLLLPILSL